MLDQNTDRMWYVIGAILIGAAILFGFHTLMPSAFASVSDAMVSVMPDSPTKRYLGPDEVRTNNAQVRGYDAETNTWTVRTYSLDRWWDSGLRPVKDWIEVPFGSTLTAGYEIYIPEDIGEQISMVDINNVLVDGSRGWSPSGNDNDEIANRLFNGQSPPEANPTWASPVTLVPGKWTKVWFSYTNTSPENTSETAVYDTSIMGFQNKTGETVDIQIRNIWMDVK